MVALKQQSAMEYLTTYGWTVLIIAIVLIAMLQLGLFGSTVTSPHATAGACQVIKTVQGANLEGLCNNIPPQFVAQFNGQNSQFYDPSPAVTSQIETISAWVYAFPPVTALTNEYVMDQGTNDNLIQIYQDKINAYFNGRCQNSGVSPGIWYFVAASYDGTYLRLYVNGALVCTSGVTASVPAALYVGRYGGSNGYNWNGLISNVQIYNATLSANQINALYMEGIGGAPITPQGIVTWWPLNGNAQDYSGKGDGGAATSISYNATWSTTYTPP